jgi:tetratricopeptide (TPR) repeat protein
VEALRLLNNDRAPEADLLLQQALKIDANNPFTLNNMGFAKEKEGELEEAIRSYTRSAQTGSREPVIVAMNRNWRGRPVSEVAAENAENARAELARAANIPDQVARLNLRGVSAMNRNDRKAAAEYFQKAYKLEPNNAFTINNMGYLAEIEGDKESAQSYYEQARIARRASTRVAVATRPEVEGQAVGQVADQSTSLVDAAIQTQAEQRRATAGAPVLRTRDNRPVPEPARPANQTQPQQQQPPAGNPPNEPVLIPRGQQQQQPPEQNNSQPPLQ